MPSNNLEPLVAEIKQEFVPARPIDATLLVLDGDWETDSLRRQLGELDLANLVPDSFVARNCNSLPAFTNEGLHVVLGSYLSFSIRYPESDAAEYVGTMLLFMSPTCPGSRYDSFRKELTAGQKRVIGSVYTKLVEFEPDVVTSEMTDAQAWWNQLHQS